MKNKLLRILWAILLPPPLLYALLVPASIALLVLSFTTFGEASPISIIGYVLSAYTLTSVCFRIPDIIKLIERIKENKYVRLYNTDARLRMLISLGSSVVLNLAYGIFQLVLGIYHGTFWYTSFAIYYLLLAFMRYYLGEHVYRHKAEEDMKREIGKYIATGVVLLVMNLVLGGIVTFMVAYGRTFYHHFITTIAMAAFTFTTLIISIINAFKGRKNASPVFRAARSVSLTSCAVSLLTLTTSMLTTFGDADAEGNSGLILAMTGAGVVILVLVIAVFMIVKGSADMKKLTEITNNTEYNA